MRKKLSLKISGLNTKEKVQKLEEAFNFQAGIRAKIKIVNSSITFYYDSRLWNKESIIDFLTKLEFNIIENFKKKKREIHYFQLVFTILLSLPIFYTSLILKLKIGWFDYLPPLNINIYLQLSIGAIIHLFIGGYYYQKVISSIKLRQLRSSFLLLLTTLIIYVYSCFNFINYQNSINYDNFNNYILIDFSCLLFILYLISKSVEYKLNTYAEDYQKALSYLVVEEVRVLLDDQEITKKIDEVDIDDLVIVASNQIVPCNGIIVKGFSYFDKSIINGDSTPIYGGKDEKVLSGTMNLAQEIIIKVTDKYEDSLLSQILKYIDNTHTLKDYYNNLLNKIYNYYFIFIILATGVIFSVSFLVNNDFDFSIKLYIYILAGAIPVSLTLSVPISAIIGLDKFNNAGISIKHYQIIPEVINSKAIIFSHVGTLSSGKVRVNNFEMKDSRYGDILYAFENQYSSPIAQIVIDYLNLFNYKANSKIKFENIGSGRYKGTIGFEIYYFGSYQFAKELLKDNQEIEEYYLRPSNENHILLFLICNNQVVAKLAMSDNLKEASGSTIRRLVAMDYQIFVFSSEDCNKKLEKYIGVSRENIFYNIKPIDKVNKLDEIKEKYRNVIYIGDCLNDAPCIIRASIGISINDGLRPNIETSNVVIKNDDLTAIPRLINYCHKIHKNIIQNIFLSLICPLFLITAIVIFNLNFYLIILYIVLSQLLVSLNAVRLKETKV